MTDGRPCVLFDVDGTLVDSNYLHTIAWSRAVRDGGEWAPMNAIHRLIGMGSDTFLPTLIGREDPAIAARWKTHYDSLIHEVCGFPSAAELLRDLARSGFSVVLATSSPAEHLDYLTRLLGLGDEIAAVTTSDDVERSKPDPEIFLTAMARVDGEASTTIVVGDSRWDVEAANAAGLRCIAVESGGFSESELSRAGAIAVYEDVDALRRSWRDSPLGELVRS